MVNIKKTKKIYIRKHFKKVNILFRKVNIANKTGPVVRFIVYFIILVFWIVGVLFSYMEVDLANETCFFFTRHVDKFRL